MIALAWLLLSCAALVTVGLWLDRRYTDPLVARLCDDDEWARLVAAVEGEDWAAWEQEVAS
jgi:hypothetical protein